MVTWDNIPQQHTRYLSACVATNYTVEFNCIHYRQCDTPSHREGLIFRQTLTWIPAATRLTVKATGHFNESKELHTGGYSLCHVTDLVLTFPRNFAYFAILSVSLSNEIYGSNTKWFQLKQGNTFYFTLYATMCLCVCMKLSNMKVCPSY